MTEASKMPLTGFLPVHPFTHGRMDLFRAAALLQSLDRTGSLAELERIVIPVPDHTLTAASVLPELLSDGSRIEVMAESKLFTEPEHVILGAQRGWRKQQFIKLAASRVIDKGGVLVMDSDILNRRRIDLSAMAPGGRLPIQRGAQGVRWMADSASVLGVEIPEKPMGVTPAMLSVDILRAMEDRLSRGAAGWIEFLAKSAADGLQWTEYMLYQSFAEAENLWDVYHEPAAETLFVGLWKGTKVNELFFEKVADKNPVFIVSQSIRLDGDVTHLQLRERGLPSLYDLSAGDLRSISSALEGSTRPQSDRPAPNSLKSYLLAVVDRCESAFPNWDEIREAASLLEVAVPERFVKVMDGVGSGAFHGVQDQLAPLATGATPHPQILALYYRGLAAVGNYLVLYADAARRVREGVITAEQANFVVGLLESVGRGEQAAWLRNDIAAAADEQAQAKEQAIGVS